MLENLFCGQKAKVKSVIPAQAGIHFLPGKDVLLRLSNMVNQIMKTKIAQ
jgi:hypothetical protein